MHTSRILGYVSSLSARRATGRATEHSYRADLQSLIEGIDPTVLATNEPTRIECGAPDYIVTRGSLVIGYIEAKDVDNDLDRREDQEQFDRYKKALPNLVITNYVDFQFIRDGECVAEVSIGALSGAKVVARPENFELFIKLLSQYLGFEGGKLKSSAKLAEIMASNARLLAILIHRALDADVRSGKDTSLLGQYEAFKNILIQDIELQEFADLYAQTIAYGMFAARLHDPTPEDFSRTEAAELIPKSNPFLRNLFQYVAGNDLDDRIRWNVDCLADIFSQTDVRAIVSKFSLDHDPLIHFYQDFLTHYDPTVRKARGIWYTPTSVVEFIVRNLDLILVRDFDLRDGLACTEMAEISVETQVRDGRTKSGFKSATERLHRVQVLDPAVGTGTFLASVVRSIAARFDQQPGMWESYVSEHLIPRLNGFELLMAPYAVAHLKLDLILRSTGYSDVSERFRIFLTNTLEAHHRDTGTLFATWLSKEATEANLIKRDTPIFVITGNPPYAISSSNKGAWIQDLLTLYKTGLNERKVNLDDDYIKFIRYAHHLIERTGEGVVGYVVNNSFLDGITHRVMREKLMQAFTSVYVLNLHGNSKLLEKSPDGSRDENVFDIMQGVAIVFFVRVAGKSTECKVYYEDLYGLRSSKYEFLNANSIDSVAWKILEPTAPQYLFIPSDKSLNAEYERGFSLDDLFTLTSSGVQTKRDKLTIKNTREDVQRVLDFFYTNDPESIRTFFELGEDGRDWKVSLAKEDVTINDPSITPILYRPFDTRYTAYTGKSKGFLAYPRQACNQHIVGKENISLIFKRRAKIHGKNYSYCFVTSGIISEGVLGIDPFGREYAAPLYLYDDEDLVNQSVERLNLDARLAQEIARSIGASFSPHDDNAHNCVTPLQIVDYVYACLYCPKYTTEFRAPLSMAYPRVPFPRNADFFRQLVALGKNLRLLHLLEDRLPLEKMPTYPERGNNIVSEKVGKKNFREVTSGVVQIWINDHQYFDAVPTEVVDFYIGGYQPVQKWLKDRKGMRLSFEDIRHYQEVIAVLTETLKIQTRIDEVWVGETHH